MASVLRRFGIFLSISVAIFIGYFLRQATLSNRVPDSAFTADVKHVVLFDGRRLAFSEYGDSEGKPIIFLHGLGQSRLFMRYFDDKFRALGIRMICPERPGYGLSDPKYAMTLREVANDTIELLDELKLSSFSILASSVGSQYALATAYELQSRKQDSRIIKIGLSAPASPIISNKNEDLPFSTKAKIFAATYAQPALYWFFNFLRGHVTQNPDALVDAAITNGSSEDVALLSQEAFRHHMVSDIQECWKFSHFGVSMDVVNNAKAEWGFDFSKLKPMHDRILVWMGQHDHEVPVTMSQNLVRQLDGAKVTIYENDGHYHIVSHMEEILLSLL